MRAVGGGGCQLLEATLSWPVPPSCIRPAVLESPLHTENLSHLPVLISPTLLFPSAAFKRPVGPAWVTPDPYLLQSQLTGPRIPSARSLAGSAQGRVCVPGGGAGGVRSLQSLVPAWPVSVESHNTSPLCVAFLPG